MHTTAKKAGDSEGLPPASRQTADRREEETGRRAVPALLTKPREEGEAGPPQRISGKKNSARRNAGGPAALPRRAPRQADEVDAWELKDDDR
jgi:hypothetical protein